MIVGQQRRRPGEADLGAHALWVFLPSRALHIVVLGPWRRAEKLLAAIADDSGLPAEPWRRLSAPVGLALGAETPEEIALAIVAEAQAVISGEQAGFLRDRAGPIHGARAATDCSAAGAADREAAE